MLHDAKLSAPTSVDRRSGARAALPLEITMLWHFDPTEVLRFSAVDVSDGGMKLRTSTPLVEGMTGMVLNLLPKGEPVNRAAMVVWVRPVANDNGYEAGLRFF